MKSLNNRFLFKRIFEITLFIGIIIGSVVIFVFRKEITNVSNVTYLGLFLLCFLANSTVLLPSPGIMIAISCAQIMNPYLVSLIAAVGFSLGELVGYLTGVISSDISSGVKRVLDKCLPIIKNSYFLVFLLALLPLPFFDIVGIYSGGIRLNAFKFWICCFAGKIIKVFFYVFFADFLFEFAMKGIIYADR